MPSNERSLRTGLSWVFQTFSSKLKLVFKRKKPNELCWVCRIQLSSISSLWNSSEPSIWTKWTQQFAILRWLVHVDGLDKYNDTWRDFQSCIKQFEIRHPSGWDIVSRNSYHSIPRYEKKEYITTQSSIQSASIVQNPPLLGNETFL
jgi:hypothetical protein